MKSTLPLAMTALLTLAACAPKDKADEGKIIDRTDYKSETGIFDIECMESLGRVSGIQVSPDGSQVLYGISYESIEENASNRDLYVKPIAGGDSTRLTRTPKSENGEVWIDNGDRIAFLYPDKEGKPQVWAMKADGSNRTQLTTVENGVGGFLFSPDQSKIALIVNIKSVRTAEDIYPDLPKATGRVIDDLMYKHWDEWVTEIPHPFVGNFDGTKVTDLTDIMIDEPYEAPMKPFGGIESLAWTPDGNGLVYVSRKKTGLEYAISTNSDLYLYDFNSKTTSNLTEGMMGYDTNPAFSPDGTKLAWLSMERDGYEADRNRLFVMDWPTREKQDITADWDYTIDEFVWAKDSKSIKFIAPYHGFIPMFSIDLASHQVTTMAENMDYAGIAEAAPDKWLALAHTFVHANEIYTIENGKVEQFTGVNDATMAQLTLPTAEKHMVKCTNGEEMLVWMLLPPNFDPNKKYPSILYCQGGPQSALSQYFSFRWNLCLMASHGYVIIAPNRHGLPGFGSAWNEQISKDYPGQNMKDYLSAADYAKSLPYIDPDKMGATGASYGGFSVYWLAGNHEHRFAALLAHAGIFNTEAQYLETEEMWFANWDMGGAFWEKDNAAAQRTHSMSPHRFVDKWDTPIMITHGEYDYRILSSQGEMAFNAAKLRGIPAEMVIFPDENHWILKPQNAVMWQRLFFRWFDRWLKDEK
ncbi:MAG: S9 family peptidase [Bacteroidales bacterium]|nr:S9 family peptidase [Bacteroidales bacterium]